MHPLLSNIVVIAAALGSATAPALAETPKPTKALEAAVAAPNRSAANKARDMHRHPAETLAFFGAKPTDTIVEIWPGGGWYTEILAPYLKDHGQLIVAAPMGRGADGSLNSSTRILPLMARLAAPTSQHSWAAQASPPEPLIWS